MYNIIVAGACGFIGSSLVRRLINEDAHIWAVDKFIREGALPLSEKITIVRDDSEHGALKNALANADYDAFYNFAWQGVNGQDKAKYNIQINNIALAVGYAELAKELGCKKYLCAGTIAERAMDSLSSLQRTTGGMMYSAAKYCCHAFLEAYCKSVGQDFVWLQLSNIYGPKNKTGNLISYTIEQLKKGEPAIFGPAKQPYDFLYADDLIEAICRIGLTETSQNFYYIGSGNPRILGDYLHLTGRIYGRLDLIHIGERPDDGIRYSFDMLDCSATKAQIGDYVSDSFENHIRYTIEHY